MLQRYLFPQEICHYPREENNLKLIKICEFPNLDKPLTEYAWNIAIIARAN